MLILIFLVLWGVSHFVFLDQLLIVKNLEITWQTVSHYNLILEYFVNLKLCLTEWFCFGQVMWSYTGDPRPEVCYPTLWLHIFVIKHLPIVVDNWHSITYTVKSDKPLPSQSIAWPINFHHFTVHCNHRCLTIEFKRISPLTPWMCHYQVWIWTRPLWAQVHPP